MASHDEIAPFQSAATTPRNGYPPQSGRPAQSGMPGFRSSPADLPYGHDDRTNARQARRDSAQNDRLARTQIHASEHPHMPRVGPPGESAAPTAAGLLPPSAIPGESRKARSCRRRGAMFRRRGGPGCVASGSVADALGTAGQDRVQDRHRRHQPGRCHVAGRLCLQLRVRQRRGPQARWADVSEPPSCRT